jgi:subtilase family serine protease
VGPGFARCNAIQLVRVAAPTHSGGSASPGKHHGPTTTTTTPKSTTTTSTSTTTTSTTTTSTTTTSTTTTSTTSTTIASGCTKTHPGYTPCDLQSAYATPSTSNGSGQTVAIVDAFNDANAEADLGVYRTAYGLPACTTANGCFRKVDQNGGSNYPRGNSGWGEEISLDLDMVSAVCPNCHILLVEAASNSLSDLATAFRRAAGTAGVVAVSNSYGGGDSSSDTLLDGSSYYDFAAFPHVAVTVSSGDSGYGVEYPASSPYVTAVGGTSLVRAAGSARGWSETAWSGAGSGCSEYEAQPSWQTSLGLGGCTGRMVADVSAVADPNTPVAVYDTYSEGGWLEFGGTSVASPIVASVYALAGNTASLVQGSYPYGHTASLNDVTSGSNGNCTTGNPPYPAYLCNGEVGYDGPTGLGTPAGIGGF